MRRYERESSGLGARAGSKICVKVRFLARDNAPSHEECVNKHMMGISRRPAGRRQDSIDRTLVGYYDYRKRKIDGEGMTNASQATRTQDESGEYIIHTTV